MDKTCTVCGCQKPSTAFEPKRRQCKECRSAYRVAVKARWYAANRDWANAYSKQWRAENEARRYEVRRQAYWAAPEEARTAAADYRRQNPSKTNAWARKRQCTKALRTPAWLTDDDFWVFEQAYELAKLRTHLFGFAWEVDHVIPLRGKNVSGLHVPQNIQVIPERANKVKSNRYVVVTT